MICAKCGTLMDQTDKNTMTGRDLREYECRKCGHTDWADEGVALWKVMHDAREEDEADAGAQAAANAAPEAAPLEQNPRTSVWQRVTRLLRSKK